MVIFSQPSGIRWKTEGYIMTTYTIAYYLNDNSIFTMKRRALTLKEVVEDCKARLNGRGWIVMNDNKKWLANEWA